MATSVAFESLPAVPHHNTLALQGFRILSLTLLACASSKTLAAQQMMKRDSAGVEIIEFRKPTSLPGISLSPSPIARFGGTRPRGEEELVARSGVLLALRHQKGFLVADGERLLLFNVDGSLAKSIGRRGAGPGEFQNITGLCHIAGDSILAFDYRLRRYSVFDAQGMHARTQPVPGFTYGQPCLQDGSFLVRESEIAGATMTRKTAPYKLQDIRGKTGTEFGELPLEVSGLFSRQASLVGHGERFYVADGEYLRFTVYSREGRLLRSVRVAGTPAPISAAEVAARLKSAVPTNQSKEDQLRVRGLFLRMPILSAWPMLWKLLVATDGVVWANETDRSGQHAGWLAFSAEGGLLGRMPSPIIPGAERIEIIGFGVREAYVSYIDADGSPTIAVYAVRFPASKGASRSE